MHLRCLTPTDAVVAAVKLMLSHGASSSPRGVATYEVMNVSLDITQPWQVPIETLEGRELRPFIGAVEALQLVGQVSDPDLVATGSKPMGRFRDHGVYHGAYGVRVHADVGKVVDLLKRDRSSRQAVLTVFDAKADLLRDVKDVPCTLSVQFLVRDEQLHMRVSMRSNDVWLGLPYDLTQFAALQGAVARALDLPMGRYVHTVGSMHLYAADRPAALNVSAPAQRSAPYQPLWTARSIDDIARTARAILTGRPATHLGMDFELWCRLAMADALDAMETNA